MTRFSCILSLLVLALTSPFSSSVQAEPQAPIEIYRWDAAHWLTTYNKNQFAPVPFTNPDGTAGVDITVTPRNAGNPYNHIIVSAANMKGGNEYTAAITFSILEPAVYPTNFYMFARNSLGNQYDIWQTWIGRPGPTRTIYVPLELRNLEGGNWKIYMGISKSGGIRINRFVVYTGRTMNGTTPFATAPPLAGVKPASELPKGLVEATGYTPFTASPPAPPTATLSMADYKIVADSPGAGMDVALANGKAFQQALTDCKSKGAVKLIFPPGVYRMATATSLDARALTDVTIDGQGARLVFCKITKEGRAWVFNNCTRLQIENLIIDWDWSTIPVASLGTVSHLSADKLQCDFTFADLNAAQTKAVSTAQWRAIFSMDPVLLVANVPGNFLVPKGTAITIPEGGAGNILHATFPTPVPFEEGKSYCIRHLYYDMAGFKLADSTDVTFKNVDVYCIPGMAWFFGVGMHNSQMLNCRIMRAPGTRTPFTSAADGIHVDETLGNLNIENCAITGTGDDTMNIHDEVYQATTVVDPADPKKLTLINCPPWQLRLKVGDKVEFYNADFSYLGDSTTSVTREVSAVSATTKGVPQTVLQFTEPVPSEISPQSILRNTHYLTNNVRISGCKMENTNGRGILLSARNATISDCHFNNVGTAIDLESEIVQPLWTQGRGAVNVVIKNNIFENDNKFGRYGGAVIYTNTRIPWGPTLVNLYDRMTIENNQFINCPGPAVSLTNSSNVIVRGNEIHANAAVVGPTRYSGTIFAINSSKLAFGGNTWVIDAPAASTFGVVYDPATTSEVSLGTNALVDLQKK